MNLEELSSAIYNNVFTGSKYGTVNDPVDLEQIKKVVCSEYLSLTRQLIQQGLLSKDGLYTTLNCIPVDCEDIERCCIPGVNGDLIKHFEIPLLLSDFGFDPISYLGSTTRINNYYVYLNNGWIYHKHKRRGANEPYIWIDTSPNKNGMNDGYVFNAHSALQRLSITAIFKDFSQLEDYGCCMLSPPDFGALASQIETTVTNKYLQYYRSAAVPVTPTDQKIK